MTGDWSWTGLLADRAQLAFVDDVEDLHVALGAFVARVGVQTYLAASIARCAGLEFYLPVGWEQQSEKGE